MLNKLLIFFLILVTGFRSNAQSFSHSYGVTLSFLQGRETADGPYKNLLIQKCGTYFPRYNLSEMENTSLSVGIPLSAGIGSVNNGDGVIYSVDAPLVGDLNFGCKSMPDNENGFGGFVGAGFGYTYTNFASYFGSGNVSSYGPVVHAGIRFVISQKFSEVLVVGGFYKFGIEAEKYKTFGFNILAEL